MWRIKEPWTFTPQKIKFCYHLSFYKFYNCYNCYFILLFCYHLSLLSLKPCELQKPIPNHQSSFCWICLPRLTLSIIRSSCPPSHHWTSLGFHFAGLNPISLVGLSRWPGAGRYLKHINWSLGFPRDRFLDPSSSPHTLHHWLPSYRHMASPTISKLMAHSSIFHFDQMIQR